MNNAVPSHRQRVNLAIAHQSTDRTPRDFAAVPEIWTKLGEFFEAEDRNEILNKLDVDCRIVSYDSFCQHPDVDSGEVDGAASMERSSVGKMWRKVEPDGSNRDIWGAHRKPVANQFGALDQFVDFPLEHAETVEDLETYRWPKPDWWDFTGLRNYIDTLNGSASYSIRYRMGSVFETAWSLFGFEKMQLCLAISPELPTYIMERIAEVHLENLRTVLETTGDLIDIVYYYDDIASQDSLLISPKMYATHIQPFHRRIIDLAGSFDKPVMLHCCGSVYPLIEQLIEMGLSVLNPVQPSAKNMNPETLADEFGDRITFHGGIDVQQFLPFATPEQVKERVAYTCNVLGQNGGYIMSGSHHLQADTPIENVLTMYGVKQK